MYYNDYLSHHGIKGQRWGVRRFQNKDGSLTLAGKKRALKMQDEYTRFTENPKYRDKQGNLTYSGRKKALKMKEQYSQLTGKKLTRYPGVKKQNVQQEESSKKKNPGEETLEEKRARLLKSNDPAELYRNKNLLTTNELNERINRIDTEQRLASKIPRAIPQETVKKGSTFVEKLDKANAVIIKTGNIINNGKTVVKMLADTSIGKSLAEKIGMDLKPKNEFDLNRFLKNRNSASNQEIEAVAKRLQNERKIKTEVDRRNKEVAEAMKQKQEAAQKEKNLKDAWKQVDNFNKQREERENAYYHSGRTKKNVDTGSSFVDQLFKEGPGTASSSNVNTGRDYANTLLLEDKRKVNGRYLLPGS